MNRPRYVFLYALALLFALFDATLSHRLSILTIRPEVIYVIPLFWALQNPSDEVVVHAWTAGLLKDLFSLSPFGTYGLIFAFLGFLFTLVQPYLYRHSTMTLILAALVFELVANGLYGVLFFLTGANLSLLQTLMIVCSTAAYSTLCGMVLLRLLVWFEAWLGFERY